MGIIFHHETWNGFDGRLERKKSRMMEERGTATDSDSGAEYLIGIFPITEVSYMLEEVAKR